MEQLSAVEMIYMYLLDDFRRAHSGRLDDVKEVDAVIRYLERRWPEDVKRYNARFGNAEPTSRRQQ